MHTTKYTMKFLVLATTLSLSAAQGFFGLQAHPSGALTPIDEPRVAALKADHLATKFAAGPVVAAAPAYAPAYGYAGPLNLNTHLVAHPNGAVVPVDEPAVAAARADHFAAQGAAFAAAGPVVAAAPVVAAGPVAAVGYAGPLNLNTHLVARPNGAVVPADEPAVAAARADHFAAGGGLAGGLYAGAAVGPYGYGAGYGYGLVAHPNGAVVPVDEPSRLHVKSVGNFPRRKKELFKNLKDRKTPSKNPESLQAKFKPGNLKKTAIWKRRGERIGLDDPAITSGPVQPGIHPQVHEEEADQVRLPARGTRQQALRRAYRARGESSGAEAPARGFQG